MESAPHDPDDATSFVNFSDEPALGPVGLAEWRRIGASFDDDGSFDEAERATLVL